MSGLTVDASHQRDALRSGQHGGPGGLANWASDLVHSALSRVGLQAEVRASTSSADAEWSVEVRLSGKTVVFIDVDGDAHGQVSIDRLELVAARTWRGVTRNAASGEVRPWLGAIRFTNESVPDALGVERLQQLVASRVLDTACVVVVDDAAGDVWSPSPARSIESFQSALIGRCLVLTTLR